MIQMISLLALAFAVSLDSFGVGLTYGLRKIRIPWKSLLFIASCSAVSISLAMGLGTYIQLYLSEEFASGIGGVILILIGAWALCQTIVPKKSQKQKERQKPSFSFEIKLFGIVIRILREPLTADIDNSGTITGKEAFLLGFALSLDAFGAGIGAALIGFSPFWLAGFVALMSAMFLTVGMKSGFRFADSTWMKKFSFLPGLLLILLGVANL